MNIFDIYLDKILILIKKLSNEGTLVLPENLNGINVDIPPSNFDCDISTNVAMVLSKINKKAPIDIAKTLVDLIKSADDEIETISVVKPGFINIKFKSVYWNNFIKSINQNHIDFGVNTKEKKRKYLVEFVSANPTGPLHVGHCRGAILGDVISNLLIFNKHDVSKEYYVNDYGNQIINFTKSVYYRAREIVYNEKFPIENSELYPGDYLIEIAKNIIATNKKLKFDKFEDISKKLTLLSVAESLKLIKSNLSNLGITHDKFTSETEIIFNKEVEKVIEKLKEKNLVYQGKIKAPKSENDENWIEREQLLFKATDFGDDKDRALQKSDKSWTYFASDVAYHNNKLNRGHDVLINILGADHAGYIKRITSVVEALSGDKNKLICKVSQLVKLIKEGKPFKMSKRKGDYITVEDLISEVGKDATRFIMLNRSSDVELDFDFAKVKEKSKDNPLYYVQYCFARISSVYRHVGLDINKDLDITKFDFKYSIDEIKILKKVAEWPKCIEAASLRLEPHRIPVYLYELSSEFHSYWNMGKDDSNKRFINDKKIISNDKLVFLKIISNVIRAGMNIVGVATPEKM
ncbi:arginyl-tRNA synthetase [Candidatus Pelagibacter ubique]|uniref:Arginine--tRNA ligase n=1 Tax=Pelagibacter ubique TaxID=198252 RepID=A0ABX1T4T3_PELUQ|nr:arginine--tRNA ligase [Candidatus Pelagibacter ubique]NMN68043.1 arginyl-tRNA synthetase [Candidatus Pelagibacter ubique]